ncbi:MAG: hypothetical protein AAGA58_12800, partial [Verrucomicrobiota bacterium]
MTEIDFSSYGFWDGLSAFGELRFHYESTEVAFDFSTDFQAGFLNDQGCYTLLNPSVSIETDSILRAFAREQTGASPPALEFDFDDYTKRIRFSVLPGTNLRTFSRFAKTFSQGRFQETDRTKLARSLNCPQLCPCCQEAGNARIKDIERNPLTRLLRNRMASEGELLVTLAAHDSRIFSSIRPSQLQVEGAWLVSEDLRSRLQIHIPSIHGFFLAREEIDGVSYAAIKVLNTHGLSLV